MRIGIVGTGAIARLHARVYKSIGFSVRACTNRTTDKGRQFAADVGAEYLPDLESLCAHHEVDVVDVCTLPQFRIEAVEMCARYGKAHPGAEADRHNRRHGPAHRLNGGEGGHRARRGEPASI